MQRRLQHSSFHLGPIRHFMHTSVDPYIRIRAGLSLTLLCAKNDVMATRLKRAGGVEYAVLDAFLSVDSPPIDRISVAFQWVILAPFVVGGERKEKKKGKEKRKRKKEKKEKKGKKKKEKKEKGRKRFFFS